jgi:hypothetical protein
VDVCHTLTTGVHKVWRRVPDVYIEATRATMKSDRVFTDEPALLGIVVSGAVVRRAERNACSDHLAVVSQLLRLGPVVRREEPRRRLA